MKAAYAVSGPVLRRLLKLVSRKPALPLLTIDAEIRAQRKLRLQEPQSVNRKVLVRDILAATTALDRYHPDPQEADDDLVAARAARREKYASGPGKKVLENLMECIAEDVQSKKNPGGHSVASGIAASKSRKDSVGTKAGTKADTKADTKVGTKVGTKRGNSKFDPYGFAW